MDSQNHNATTLLFSLDSNSSRNHQDDASLEACKQPQLSQKPFNWKAPAIILGFEFLESIAYSGVALNLVTYLGTVLHGATASNAANVDTWNGTTYLAPIIGAILADTYWGKYKTIFICVILYLIGMLIITLSAAIPSLRPASCEGSSCPPATEFQYIVFFFALYLVGIGTGGVKSALLPFGADQYDDQNPEESRKKQLFFSWFFVSVNLGVFISGIVVVWLQEHIAWSLGYGIASLCLIIAAVGFFSGTPIYRVQLPSGSPLKSVVKVLIASVKKRNLELPADSSLLYEVGDEDYGKFGQQYLAHTHGFKFLDKAAIVTDSDTMTDDNAYNSPLICTVTQVEELKILLRMLPIWASSVFYAASICQMSTTFILQGNAMNTKIGSLTIPAASLTSVEVIFIIGWVLLHDKVVIPAARKYFRNSMGLSQLQRMGVGRFLVILSMAAAALIEAWRLESVKAGHTISIAWQIIQYVILAGSDVFSGIAQLEFFYGEAPETMRSMCSAFSFLAMSLGFYVNSFIITLVAAVTKVRGSPGWIPTDLNKGHLDYYFWLWAGISALNFIVFLAFARNYTLKVIVH